MAERRGFQVLLGARSHAGAASHPVEPSQNTESRSGAAPLHSEKWSENKAPLPRIRHIMLVTNPR